MRVDTKVPNAVGRLRFVGRQAGWQSSWVSSLHRPSLLLQWSTAARLAATTLLQCYYRVYCCCYSACCLSGFLRKPTWYTVNLNILRFNNFKPKPLLEHRRLGMLYAVQCSWFFCWTLLAQLKSVACSFGWWTMRALCSRRSLLALIPLISSASPTNHPIPVHANIFVSH